MKFGTYTFDEQALIAAVDLIGRSNARSFEIGYLHDDVPTPMAGWWASAIYKGARVMVDDAPGPVDAAEMLAQRLLTGGTCRRCGKLIQIRGEEPGCQWRREGRKWKPGCDLPIDLSLPLVPR